MVSLSNNKQLLLAFLLVLAIPVTVFMGVRVRQNILERAAAPRTTTGSELPTLAVGNWPRECPECVNQRFYHDFWPTPLVIANGEEEYMGTTNSTRLFNPDGSGPNSWPPPALQGLNPYYVYQLSADHDGDGRDEILSIYAPMYANRSLNLRLLDPRSPTPLVERSYPWADSVLENLAVADLNGDGKDEIILEFGKDEDSFINVYGSDLGLLWQKKISQCTVYYLKRYNSLAVGDVDGDNKKEIFFGCAPPSGAAYSGKIYAFSHDGSAFRDGPPDDPYLFAALGSGPPDMVLGDVNGDGSEEIVANLPYKGDHLVVLDAEGNVLGEKVFGGVEHENDTHASSLTLANIDNDGPLEILVGDVRAEYTTSERSYFGQIRVFTFDLNGGGNVTAIRGLNREDGLVWESTEPLVVRDADILEGLESGLSPSAVLVGDVSGDGVNDLITSWRPHSKIYAFTVQKNGAHLSLSPIAGWPIELPMPENPNPTLATVSRNAIALADVDNDNKLELIAVGRDFGSGFDSSGWDNNTNDDRYFAYLFETPGKVSSDLEWPVWQGNFGLTGEYQEPPSEPEPPSPSCEDRPPDAPSLVGPLNGAESVSVWARLSWNPILNWGTNCQGNNNRATVYLYNDSGAEIEQNSVEGAQTSTSLKNLKSATNYQWKVSASNGALSADSDVWRFATCVPESRFAGDLDCDCRVSLPDLVLLAKIYHSKAGEPEYDPALDIVQTPQSRDEINLYDLVYVAAKYGTQCND